MVNVGVIGCGHWGPNHVRIFSHLARSRAVMAADLDEQRLKAIKQTFLNIRTTKRYQDILEDPDIDAVCVAAPTQCHFSITQEALRAGKHVLCEKPLAETAEKCRILRDLAQEQDRVLMVGHIFIFNRGIRQLKTYIDSGEIGRVHYAYALRTNLGPFRYDVNALWDLAPHDIAIFNYLFDHRPVNVSGRGQRCLGTAQEDLAFATLQYPEQVMVHVHVSWLDPKKVRQITIVGDKKMATWDDLDPAGPIKLYDKHVEKTETYYETYGEFQLLSREGSVLIPHIGMNEPLKEQAEYFLDCVEHRKDPLFANAQKGLEVVETLEAVQRSMDEEGACVYL